MEEVISQLREVSSKSTGLISSNVSEQRIVLKEGIYRHKLMLGPYLASLYGIETRVVIQAVQRIIDRFPEDFMFALIRELIEWISQIVRSLKFVANGRCAHRREGK